MPHKNPINKTPTNANVGTTTGLMSYKVGCLAVLYTQFPLNFPASYQQKINIQQS